MKGVWKSRNPEPVKWMNDSGFGGVIGIGAHPPFSLHSMQDGS